MFRIYFSNNVQTTTITQQLINQNNALKIEDKQEKGNSIFAMLKNTLINPGETVSNAHFSFFSKIIVTFPHARNWNFILKTLAMFFQLNLCDGKHELEYF